MTIATESNRMAAYATDGIITGYDFDFEIYDEAEVEVWYRESGKAYSQLGLNTDFGVTFGDGAGTVTTDGYRAPLQAGALLLIRHLNILQETDWFNNDSHSEDQHQIDFDRGCMIDLQQQEELDRSPKFIKTSSTRLITFPEPEADRLISWNGDADNLKNITLAEIAQYVASLLNNYSAPTTPATGQEILAPGNVAGDDGNFLLVIDDDGHLIFRVKVVGVWKSTGPKIRGS